jgi:hypothetical protein
VLTPLTPSLDYERSAPSGIPEHPVPDLRAEQILFNLYLSEKARADYWKAQAKKKEQLLHVWKHRGYAKKIVSHMPISRNDQPSGRKVQ